MQPCSAYRTRQTVERGGNKVAETFRSREKGEKGGHVCCAAQLSAKVSPEVGEGCFTALI